MRLFWVVWLLVLPSVLGATIHGTVYDFGLNKLNNAIVEIDTTPLQKIVAKNGTYSFNVPSGNYTLSASFGDFEIEENVSAGVEGDYVLDLILLPSFEEDAFFDVPDVPMVDEFVQDRPVSGWLIWIIVFVLLAFLLYRFSKRPVIQKEIIKEVKEVAVSEELEKIVEFIDSEGGRSTQKDIRKHFPYSEAKISLMIDELEEKGLVKRIKKGRGNVVVRV